MDRPGPLRPLPGALPCLGQLGGRQVVDGEIGDPAVQLAELRNRALPVLVSERSVLPLHSDIALEHRLVLGLRRERQPRHVEVAVEDLRAHVDWNVEPLVAVGEPIGDELRVVPCERDQAERRVHLVELPRPFDIRRGGPGDREVRPGS